MELQAVNNFTKLDLENLVQRLEGEANITERLLNYPGAMPNIINAKFEEFSKMIEAIPEEEDLLRSKWLIRYLEIYKKRKHIKIKVSVAI